MDVAPSALIPRPHYDLYRTVIPPWCVNVYESDADCDKTLDSNRPRCAHARTCAGVRPASLDII